MRNTKSIMKEVWGKGAAVRLRECQALLMTSCQLPASNISLFSSTLVINDSRVDDEKRHWCEYVRFAGGGACVLYRLCKENGIIEYFKVG